jgi:hypothetical protein
LVAHCCTLGGSSFEVSSILCVDELELFTDLVELGDNLDWADGGEFDHETEAKGLDIFVGILETNDDGINNLGLVEVELLTDILQEAECTLSNSGTVINNMLERSKIYRDNEFWFDWGFSK